MATTENYIIHVIDELTARKLGNTTKNHYQIPWLSRPSKGVKQVYFDMFLPKNSLRDFYFKAILPSQEYGLVLGVHVATRIYSIL